MPKVPQIVFRPSPKHLGKCVADCAGYFEIEIPDSESAKNRIVEIQKRLASLEIAGVRPQFYTLPSGNLVMRRNGKEVVIDGWSTNEKGNREFKIGTDEINSALHKLEQIELQTQNETPDDVRPYVCQSPGIVQNRQKAALAAWEARQKEKANPQPTAESIAAELHKLELKRQQSQATEPAEKQKLTGELLRADLSAQMKRRHSEGASLAELESIRQQIYCSYISDDETDLPPISDTDSTPTPS